MLTFLQISSSVCKIIGHIIEKKNVQVAILPVCWQSGKVFGTVTKMIQWYDKINRMTNMQVINSWIKLYLKLHLACCNKNSTVISRIWINLITLLAIQYFFFESNLLGDKLFLINILLSKYFILILLGCWLNHTCML